MKTIQKREAWNKRKLVGQKPPLKLKDIWAIRIHLLNTLVAMFNLVIDSKLRGCDLVNFRVRDICHGAQILSRAMVIQRKTLRPVQFELTEPTRSAVAAWVEKAHLRGGGNTTSRAELNVLPISPHPDMRALLPTQCNLAVESVSLLLDLFEGRITCFYQRHHGDDHPGHPLTELRNVVLRGVMVRTPMNGPRTEAI